METAIETIEGDNGVKAKIFYDEGYDLSLEDIWPENTEGSSIILCSFFHRTSTLKDHNPFGSQEEMFDYAEKNDYKVFVLLRYEHSGVAFTALEVGEKPGYPFSCRWDAGVEGFVLASPTLTNPKDTVNSALNEVTDWCNGHIYYIDVTDKEEETLDSIGGCVGWDYAEHTANEMLTWACRAN